MYTVFRSVLLLPSPAGDELNKQRRSVRRVFRRLPPLNGPLPESCRNWVGRFSLQPPLPSATTATPLTPPSMPEPVRLCLQGENGVLPCFFSFAKVKPTKNSFPFFPLIFPWDMDTKPPCHLSLPFSPPYVPPLPAFFFFPRRPGKGGGPARFAHWPTPPDFFLLAPKLAPRKFQTLGANHVFRPFHPDPLLSVPLCVFWSPAPLSTMSQQPPTAPHLADPPRRVFPFRAPSFPHQTRVFPR